MNYNPYAAPQTAGPPQTPAGPDGSPQPWDIGEVLAEAWEVFKIHWVPLVFPAFIAWVIVYALEQIPRVAFSVSFIPGTSMDELLAMGAQLWKLIAVQTIIGTIAGSFFDPGLLRIQIAAARGETPNFVDMFGGGPKMLLILALKIALVVPVYLGFVFFVVPGVIAFLVLWAAEYYAVDADLGFADSLQASVRAVRGQWMPLLLFFMVGFLLELAGMCACCVGMFVTLPIYRVAKAIIFLRISGRGARRLGAHHPPPGGYVPPPGYGGGWPPQQP